MLEIRRLKIIFCLLFLFLINLGYGQYFNVETYTLQDGIPDAVVYDVVQDSSGLMWFAGRSGIFTYDGEKFDNVELQGELSNTTYVHILIDSLDNIWALPEYTNKRIVHYSNGSWKPLPLFADTSKPYSFWDFDLSYIDAKPKIVASIFESILVFFKGNWKKYDLRKRFGINAIYSVKNFNGQFYLSTNKGVYILWKDQIMPWRNVNKSLSYKEIVYVNFWKKDQKNFPTFGFLNNKSLSTYYNGKIKSSVLKFTIPKINYRMTFFLSSDKQERLYFGNQAVNFVYSNSTGKLNQLNTNSGFTTNGATSVYLDRENNVWFTTLRGINKIAHTPFINYNQASGLLEDEVATILQMKDKNIFLAHNNGYSILKNDKVVSKTIDSTSIENGIFNRILDAKIDNHGNLWAVSAQFGLGKLGEDYNFQWYRGPNLKECNSLLINDNDGILVGTTKGIRELKGSKLVSSKTFKDLDNIYIRKLFANKDGKIFFCTNNAGLYLSKNGHIINYKSFNENANNVFSLLDYEKEIYVGTLNGLYHIDNDSLKKYSKNNLQINHPVYFIINDKDGNIWFGLDNGVIKWDGQNHKHYSVEDGLAGYETNRSAAAVDDLGRVWIGTDKGLSIYLKDYDQIEIPAPKLEFLYLEDIDGISHNPAKKIFLGSSQNYFTVHFRALSFIDEKSTKYHVSILNVDNSQIDSFTTVERWARFSNIASGEYQLQIQAENVRGILSPKLTSALITIDSPYYQKAWFIIFAGLFLTGIIFFSVRFYTQRKRSQELEKMVNERTRSLEESKKQLVESERRYKGLIESQNEMIVRVDNQNRFTFVNDAYCRKFAKTREELIGNTFLPLIHPEDVTRTIEEMKYLDTPPYRIYVEQRAMTKDGWRWISWEDYAIKDENGNTVEIQAIGRDITDKKYSDKIKTQAIFDAIEKERSRISRDLHDDLGQILTGAKLKLEIAKKRSNFSETDKDGYNDAVKMLSSVGKHLRNIVHDLHPAEIERYGIFLALESLVFQIQKLTGIEIHYNYSGFNGNWNKNNDLIIYRIVQEALNNVVKHSKATEASISITGNSDEFEITVQDNGIGFDVKKTSSMKQVKRGFGLVNIQQRVELIGGRLKITSKPYEGTTLKVKFLKEVIIE